MGFNGTAGRAIAPLLGALLLSIAACGDRDGGGKSIEVVGEGCRDEDGREALKPYSLGGEFEGLALETVLLHCNGRARGDTISFIYGDCELPEGGEGGCATPLQVQVWRACARTYRDYEPGNRPPLSRRRGVPVADSGRQIEVYTDSTIVIFADDPSLARRAVSGLRPMRRGGDPTRVPAAVTPDQKLPRPPPGALENTLKCT
ncbi:MAG TPA: hypothetical protein VFQ14_02715 [Thermoleophilaceae bacterium]|nr:hypothetical protein [Thermoleophilaceae bacterium]